jgi:hypothetical protein
LGVLGSSWAGCVFASRLKLHRDRRKRNPHGKGNFLYNGEERRKHRDHGLERATLKTWTPFVQQILQFFLHELVLTVNDGPSSRAIFERVGRAAEREKKRATASLSNIPDFFPPLLVPPPSPQVPVQVTGHPPASRLHCPCDSIRTFFKHSLTNPCRATQRCSPHHNLPPIQPTRSPPTLDQIG